MSDLAHITNFVQITPAVGTAGQPRAEYFADIAAAGYSVVINLAMADSDHALPNEGNLVASLGMTYIHMPVDFQTPRPTDVARFIGLMRSLDSESGDSKIFVHCVVNFSCVCFYVPLPKVGKRVYRRRRQISHVCKMGTVHGRRVGKPADLDPRRHFWLVIPTEDNAH